MMAIQIAVGIAAGIVAAYAIIVNQRKLLVFAGWLLTSILAIAGLMLVGYALSTGFGFLGAHLPALAWPRFWQKIWTLIGFVPLLTLAATATYGMALLLGLLIGKTPKVVTARLSRSTAVNPEKPQDNSGCLALIGLALVMGAINWGLSFPAWAYTPLGRWYDAVDAYGRAHGWQDGLSIIFGALLWQWVWIPVGTYFLIKRLRRAATTAPIEEP